MKKALFYLLIISCLGIASSVLIFVSEISPFLLVIQLIICSLIGLSIFFSLYILRKENAKSFKVLFGVGTLFFLLFIWGIYNPSFLRLFWTIILSGITFVIIAAIITLLKKSNKILSFLSLCNLTGTGVLMSMSLIFHLEDPVYYKMLLILLSVSSGLVLLSSLFIHSREDKGHI